MIQRRCDAYALVLMTQLQAAVRASLEELELAKGEGQLELAELEAAIAASLALEVSWPRTTGALAAFVAVPYPRLVSPG